MSKYKQLDEKAWSDFGKKLKEKGSDMQREFLDVCKSGKNKFIPYIDSRLKESDIQGEVVDFRYTFMENEFICPPRCTQKKIYEAFKDVPEETMHNCSFWGYIIIEMIKNDQIQPDWLASKSNGVHNTGLYIIDKAIQSNDEKEIDDCIRRILRSMCNPEPRGKRIVFNDFYLGKAYWRWYWAHKMSNIIGVKPDKILKILDEKYYAEFSAKMHSKKSYISSENILGGLLLFLQKNKGITDKKLKKIIDQIAYLSIWKAIEAQTPESNSEEIQKIAKRL